MSELQSYFAQEDAQKADYPLLGLLTAYQGKPEFGHASLEIRRPRGVLGFEPAELYLHFYGKDGLEMNCQRELWDPDLNLALAHRRIRATDQPNETVRFGLGLSSALEKPETRFGDGFFNSVLIDIVRQSPLAPRQQIQELLPLIPVNKPYMGGPGYEDCQAMIRRAFHEQLELLTNPLHYAEPDADQIFASAVAYYLDERFTITDRRKLNWL